VDFGDSCAKMSKDNAFIKFILGKRRSLVRLGVDNVSYEYEYAISALEFPGEGCQTSGGALNSWYIWGR